ncbi:hypothetical protein ACFU9F_15920 [Streptomyces zhihengii]|uniref:hypothetical protein n=1 Tax=Streptomyces zhihengii TaxID=1818004 RepID=UPI0036A6C888
MLLRRLLPPLVLVLVLAVSGCVSVPTGGGRDRPVLSPAPAGPAPAGAVVPGAGAGPLPAAQSAGRDALAATGPETPAAGPAQAPPAERARGGAHGPHPAPRLRPHRPRPAVKPAPRPGQRSAPRHAPPRGYVPAMRHLCAESEGVTSSQVTRLCRYTYGR